MKKKLSDTDFRKYMKTLNRDMLRGRLETSVQIELRVGSAIYARAKKTLLL